MEGILIMEGLTIAQANSWEPYADKEHGHGHGHPKVPEPGVTGLIIVGVALIVIWMRRKK